MSTLFSTPSIQNSVEHSTLFGFPRFGLQLSERRVLLLIGDLLLLTLAGLGALATWRLIRSDIVLDMTFVISHLNWLVMLAVIWSSLLFTLDGYDLKVAANFVRIGKRLIGVTASFAIIYLLFFFLVAEQPNSTYILPWFGEIQALRVVPIAFLAIALPLELGWRSAYATLLTKDQFQRRVLVVGAGRAGTALIEAFARDHRSNTHWLVGLIDDDPQKQYTTLHSVPVLGTHEQMVTTVEKYGIDEIVIAVSGDLMGGAFQSVMDCYERGVQITPMPVMYENLTGRVPVEHVGKSWSIVLPMAATPPGRLYQSVERVADLLMASLGMVLLAVVCPLLVVANYFWSPGPLFYTQTRVGRAGKLYKILKFRSMIPDAEKRSGAVWAQAADARITPVGHFLRKTRLDEIPQFWNVLKGEMSMIGPRPERPEFVEQLADSIPFYRSRHTVKPGMTGWAQVKYRYGASVEDALMKLQYDLYYIKHQSLFLNLLILYKTIRVVIGFQGR